MNKIIEDYKKIVAGNKAGKNICFMSRGEYADPKIAYKGILMNYWDVYDCMDEVEEPTDDDWLNAVSNLLNRYQLTFESYGNHYQIYGRNIQDVMGGVTGGAGVYG
jgi:hypothetical protein